MKATIYMIPKKNKSIRKGFMHRKIIFPAIGVLLLSIQSGCNSQKNSMLCFRSASTHPCIKSNSHKKQNETMQPQLRMDNVWQGITSVWRFSKHECLFLVKSNVCNTQSKPSIDKYFVVYSPEGCMPASWSNVANRVSFLDGNSQPIVGINNRLLEVNGELLDSLLKQSTLLPCTKGVSIAPACVQPSTKASTHYTRKGNGKYIPLKLAYTFDATELKNDVKAAFILVKNNSDLVDLVENILKEPVLCQNNQAVQTKDYFICPALVHENKDKLQSEVKDWIADLTALGTTYFLVQKGNSYQLMLLEKGESVDSVEYYSSYSTGSLGSFVHHTGSKTAASKLLEPSPKRSLYTTELSNNELYLSKESESGIHSNEERWWEDDLVKFIILDETIVEKLDEIIEKGINRLSKDLRKGYSTPLDGRLSSQRLTDLQLDSRNLRKEHMKICQNYFLSY
jgi:hypothetical protein